VTTIVVITQCGLAKRLTIKVIHYFPAGLTTVDVHPWETLPTVAVGALLRAEIIEYWAETDPMLLAI